jgi:transposase
MSGAGASGVVSKKKSTHAAEQDRADVAEARRNWFANVGEVCVKDLIFIDEFGATTNMQRAYGRALRGERVVSKVPHGHWKTLSTIAAMSSQGMVASASFDGATDAATFVAFIRDAVVPLLRPGQVVVMDNLACHKNPEVARQIESHGARLIYLPPYSPDFNPIELAFSKVKTFLRKLARRTVDALFTAIAQALALIMPGDATNYMIYRGYSLQ